MSLRSAKFDEYFMGIALKEAQKAAEKGEVPTGCVIIEEPESEDCLLAEVQVLGKAHNLTESLKDATAHAEMLALSAAFQTRDNWRLPKTRLYVTKEPCPMCAGAIILARVDTVIWGLDDPKRGGGTEFGIFSHPGINHHPEIIKGVLEEPCREIIQTFFKKRREENKEEKNQ